MSTITRRQVYCIGMHMGLVHVMSWKAGAISSQTGKLGRMFPHAGNQIERLQQSKWQAPQSVWNHMMQQPGPRQSYSDCGHATVTNSGSNSYCMHIGYWLLIACHQMD